MKKSSWLVFSLVLLVFVGIGCPVDPGNVLSMTGTVSITGTVAYNEELTADPDLTNGGTITYQWKRDSVDIAGSTSSTYTLVEDDIDTIITVVATADGVAGTGSITSDGTDTVAKAASPGAPSESIVGQFPAEKTSIELSGFSANADGLEAAVANDGFTYVLYADLIVDEDGKATITGLTDVTNATKVRIRVKETATTLAGSYKEITVTAKIPEMTGTVTINGTATYDEELTADITSLINGGTVTYQWKRDSVDIAGATASTYTLVEDDIDSIITVVATADGIAGTGSITSDGTDTVTKAAGPGAPSESIVGVFPAEETSIELSGFSANATGLEAAVANDGSDYADYADLSVDSDGEATITGLTAVTNDTKVRIRVKETDTTLAGAYKEITVTEIISYEVGEIGSSGGYIFYVDTEDDFDWTFLEAAPYGWYQGATDSNGAYSGDDDPSFQWGANGYTVSPSAIGTAVGTGETSTAIIVSYHDGLGTTYPAKGEYYSNASQYDANNDGTVAAKVCAEYSLTVEGTTYDDWFLPSKDELDLMYDNLKTQTTALGSFSDTRYWSSSEYSASLAWVQYFNNGDQYSNGKVNVIRVRPVRAF